MSEHNVRFILREFGKLLDAAVERGQEIHSHLHLGSYNEPGDDGYEHNCLDGSVVLLITIDPLPPNLHHTLQRDLSDRDAIERFLGHALQSRSASESV